MKKRLITMVLAVVLAMATTALAGTAMVADECCNDVKAQIGAVKSDVAQQNEQVVSNTAGIAIVQEQVALKQDKINYNPYAAVRGGFTWNKDSDVGMFDSASFDSGWNMALAGGVRIENVRLELEGDYETSDIDDSNDASVKLINVTANAYYDFYVTDTFSIWGMGGLGAGSLDTDKSETSANVMVAKLGAGVAYDFTPALSGEVGYRYTLVPDTTIDGRDVSYESDNLMVGLRYNF